MEQRQPRAHAVLAGQRQLGPAGHGDHQRPLAAGSTLTLTVVGSTLAFAVNNTTVMSTTDTTLTGGAPGVVANGLATATNWSGGNSGFQVEYQSTASGVQTYDFLSPEDGYGIQTLRVLQPTHPAAGVAHNFLFVLPVEAGLGNTYGDGLETLQALDAEDQYNLTIVEPTFADQPWYADNPNDPNLRYESFMVNELVPWVDKRPGHHGHRAELAHRVLQVRLRGPGPDPEEPGRVHRGRLLGLPGRHVAVRLVRLEPGHRLWHRSQLCQTTTSSARRSWPPTGRRS